MSNDIEVIDPEPRGTSRSLKPVSHSLSAPEVSLRVIPRHVLNYSLTLMVQDTPYPISDAHAKELGCFACVNQKTGKTSNGNDRTRALVVTVPRGAFQCINLDDPNEVPIQQPGYRSY